MENLKRLMAKKEEPALEISSGLGSLIISQEPTTPMNFRPQNESVNLTALLYEIQTLKQEIGFLRQLYVKD